MRLPILFVASLVVIACGTTSSGGGSSGPSAGGNPPPASDAGSGSGGADAGAGGGGGVDAGAGGGGTVDAGTGGGGGGAGGGAVDAGTGGGTGSGGGSADAGSGNADGGTAASDCDGLTPAAPGAPSQFKLVNQDLNQGQCSAGESDGTGHIAVSWQNSFQPHDSRYTFVDPATAAPVGSFAGTRLVLIGQASGFMGGECQGADCFQDYVVLDSTGHRINGSPVSGTSNGVQANDPTGGMIHARLSSRNDPVTVLLDAIDASGNVRWTRALPEPFPAVEAGHVVVGVDRQGNVLALWQTSLGRFGNAWAGEWFDHDGNAGPEFEALAVGASPTSLWERVDSGLFVLGFPGGRRTWLGQIEPLATSVFAPPSWLAARPDATLHMVHGGRGYARLPLWGRSGPCEQDIEVISPSGQLCGTARFVVDGGSCMTDNITVGYDGTVVQQLPREREAACTAAGHQCDCTYRFWPGFFR
ncbi:MAG: hypothetical protein ACM3PC_10190 [Deltaproteobacteria bacterium]